MNINKGVKNKGKSLKTKKVDFMIAIVSLLHVVMSLVKHSSNGPI